MKIKVTANSNEIKNFITIHLNDKVFTFPLKVRHGFNISKPENLMYYEYFIQKCYDELILKKNKPKEIVKIVNNKLFDLNAFMYISFIVFNELFCKYIEKMIENHILLLNFDFNDFYLNFLDKRWLYIEEGIQNDKRIEIKSIITNIFKNKVILHKDTFDCYIEKAKSFTPEVHIWNIKYKNKLCCDIYFNIPNQYVREVIYDNFKFKNEFKIIEKSLIMGKNLYSLEKNKELFILKVILISAFFIEEFQSFIKNNVNQLIGMFKIVSIMNLKKQIFKETKNLTLNYILSINREGNAKANQYSNPLYEKFSNVFYDEISKGYEFQVNRRKEINLEQINSSRNIWYYFERKKNGRIHAITIDFTPYLNSNFFYEFREYIIWLIKSDREVLNIAYSLMKFIDFFNKNFKKGNYSCYDFSPEIIKKYLLSLLLNIDDSAVKTKISKFFKLKTFLDFIIKNKVSEKYELPKLNENPCIGIKFKNLQKHSSHYEPLPENVYFQILKYANELDSIIKNAFIILSATGLRWSELISLTSDCLYKKEENYYIKAKEFKNSKQKLKKGKSEWRRIPLFDKNAINSINEQINQIKKLNFDTDLIFYRRNKCYTNEEYTLVSNSSYNESINCLIKKHEITDEMTGNIWKYSSHQMRVRIATLMAENGFKTEEIVSFLNHSTSQTINYAYAFIRKKRMAELNTDFFKEHFNCIIPHDNLVKMTKKEKESLYIKLYLNYRQMEYGKCTIPLSEGDCGKLQESSNCACCQHLVTSKDYIIKWEEFYENQKERVLNLEKFYFENKINYDEYSNYLEYKRENMYLSSYKQILLKLGKNND